MRVTDRTNGAGEFLEDAMATDIRLKESLPEITEAIVATYT